MSADRIELLRSLWEGEEGLVMGYQCVSIVFHLCTFAPRYTEPNAQWVLNHLRNGYVKTSDCDDDELALIEQGLKRWRQAGKPRATFAPTEMREALQGGS